MDKKFISNLICFFLSIFPITFLLGSLIINLNTILIVLLFIIYSFKEKNFFFIKDKFFILLFLLWFSFFINLYFSNNFDNSLTRTISFVRFILLVFSIKIFFEICSHKQSKYILTTWFFIFSIISIDLIYEFTFGVNTLGFKSYMPGRLAGFLNEELKIGHLYSFFFLICAVTLFNKTKNVYLLYLFIFFSIFVSLLIGERSNFIRVFMMSVLFLFFFENKNYLKKIITIIMISLLTFTFVILNEDYQKRFYGQFIGPIVKLKNIDDVMNNTVYGANFDRAIKIFQSNKFFGVGIKNFRVESNNPKYSNDNLKFNDQAATTHPHQIHLEILSETGLVGYIFFVAFILLTIFFGIINFRKTNNLYILSSVLYFILSLIPVLPSGSFFTTFGATLFWINYGFLTFEKKINI